MEKKDIFISYKSEDFAAASWLQSTLETNGLSCWMAPASIPGGSNYAREIPRAIAECRIFVVLISRQCQTSIWVPKELDRALNCGKIIMPFMLEDCALTDDFNFYLSNVQRYEAYQNKAAAVQKMLRDIRALLHVQEVPDKEVVPPPTAQIPDLDKLKASALKSVKSCHQTVKKTYTQKSTKRFLAIIAALLVLWVLGSLGSKLTGTLTLKKIDVFEDIHVTVEGAAPYAKIDVVSTSADPFIRSIDFSVTPDTDLKRGDTITITANVSQADAKEYGYRLAADTMEYTLTDLESYITSVEMLTAADVAAVQARAEKFIADQGTSYPKFVFRDGSTVGIPANALANCLTDITFLDTGYVNISVPLFSVEAVLVVPFCADIQGVEYTWYGTTYYEDPISKDFMDAYGYFLFTGLKLDSEGNLIKEGSFGLEMSSLFEDQAAMERELFKRYNGNSLISGTFQK